MSKLITGLINEIIGSGADAQIDVKVYDNYIKVVDKVEKENAKKEPKEKNGERIDEKV